MLRLGLDPGPMTRGLLAARDQANKWARDTAGSISKTFSGTLGGLLTGAGIGAAISSVFDMVRAIKTLSETTGATTDFVQGWRSLGDSVGIGSEKAQKALQKFAMTLGAARRGSEEAIKKFQAIGVDFESGSTDQVVRRFADAIAQIPDPSMRAATAMSFLGDEGAAMVSALAKGGDELQKFIDQSDKLSSRRIQSLDNADKRLNEWGDNVKLMLANTLGAWGDFWSMLGAVSAGESGAFKVGKLQFNKDEEAARREAEKQAQQKQKELEEIARIEALIAKEQEKTAKLTAKPETRLDVERRLARLIEESGELAKEGLANQEDAVKSAEIRLKYEEKHNEILEARKKLEELQTEEKKKQEALDQKRKRNAEDIAATERRLMNQQRDFRQRQLEQYMPTLQEIAESGEWVGRGRRTRFRQGQFAGIAQEILAEEERLKRDLTLYGRDAINFDQRVDYIGSLKKQLADAGLMSPQETMAEYTKETAEHLEALRREGLSIKDDE